MRQGRREPTRAVRRGCAVRLLACVGLAFTIAGLHPRAGEFVQMLADENVATFRDDDQRKQFVSLLSEWFGDARSAGCTKERERIRKSVLQHLDAGHDGRALWALGQLLSRKP